MSRRRENVLLERLERMIKPKTQVIPEVKKKEGLPVIVNARQILINNYGIDINTICSFMDNCSHIYGLVNNKKFTSKRLRGWYDSSCFYPLCELQCSEYGKYRKLAEA